jgi:hypothetical protein
MIISKAHDEVAGGLGGPRPRRVGGDPSEVHPPGLHLDHEQDVEPAQQGGVDAGEVGGDDRGCLGADELHPRWPGPITGGIDTPVRRIFHTVDAAIRWPSRPSSPWIRRYPQSGFSPATRRINRRTSASIGGRPGERVCGWVQRRETRRRCQPITVAGFTIRNTSARRRQSNTEASIARIIRSAGVNCARLIWRCSTRTWWRRARISASR